MIDAQGRSIEYLRVAITDKCNLRCRYCMPESGVPCLDHSDLLTFEEIARAVSVMTGLGIHALRLTGGEPMARRGCLKLARMLKSIPDIDRLSMTTNGILLKGHMAEARAAGVDDINISIDTLDPEAFARITRGGDVNDVFTAILEAVDCGLRVKLNAVPIREYNRNGLCELAALAKELPVDVRFIELMPVGCGTTLTPVPTDEVKALMESAFGTMQRDEGKHGLGPAVYYKPEGFLGSIGFISAVSHEFCDGCNRVRLTPEGILKLCLNHRSGLDLRAMLRGDATDDALRDAIRDAILRKPVHHGFSEDIDDREVRRMNQIGG